MKLIITETGNVKYQDKANTVCQVCRKKKPNPTLREYRFELTIQNYSVVENEGLYLCEDCRADINVTTSSESGTYSRRFIERRFPPHVRKYS